MTPTCLPPAGVTSEQAASKVSRKRFLICKKSAEMAVTALGKRYFNQYLEQDTAHRIFGTPTLNLGIHWAPTVTAKQFHAAISGVKTYGVEEEKQAGIYLTKDSEQYGAFVHIYNVNEYEKMQTCLLNENLKKHRAGVAVNKGDIVSVFKHPNFQTKMISSKWLLPRAEEFSGNRLDCFNGALPSFYARTGYIPVAKMAFNRTYAPQDWNYQRDGEPDIIFMVRDSDYELRNQTQTKEEIAQTIKRLKYSSTYAEAKEAQLKAVSKVNTQ